MKKLLVLLAALAATSAIVAGSALAVPSPFPNVSSCSGVTGQWQEVNNLTIQPGESCFFWGYVHGTLTVNGTLGLDGIAFNNTSVGATGHLRVFHSTLTGNVGVTGGSIQFDNGPSTVGGNLSISGSTSGQPGGANMNGFWQPTSIGGNFSYLGNYIPLYGSATVAGNQNIGPVLSQ
jgi:hypothetical protein